MTPEELELVMRTTEFEVECDACGLISDAETEKQLYAQVKSWQYVDDASGSMAFCDECKEEL